MNSTLQPGGCPLMDYFGSGRLIPTKTKQNLSICHIGYIELYHHGVVAVPPSNAFGARADYRRVHHRREGLRQQAQAR